jgi:hypothetical protein
MPAEIRKNSQQEPYLAVTTTSPSTPLTVKSSSSSSSSPQTPYRVQSPEDWYATGERVWYNVQSKAIVPSCDDDDGPQSCLQVFRRVVVTPQPLATTATAQQQQQRWMTMLPSDPEGSFGYHQVEEALTKGQGGATNNITGNKGKGRCDTDITESSLESLLFLRSPSSTLGTGNNNTTMTQCPLLPRLYIDYVGQGDSDSWNVVAVSNRSSDDSTSRRSSGSMTMQRADLVEAQWHDLGIQRTVVVCAGESSALVVMELLQRQRLRLASGSPFPKILHVLALNGRFVAKSRHARQLLLPTATQLLRHSILGPSLIDKAHHSDLVLSQLLSPSLTGCSTRVRKQVATVVRRHEGGCASLMDMAKIVDDHLCLSHRYRWHLAHLLKVFFVDQGITFTLMHTSKNRTAAKQAQLVRQQVNDEYNDLADDNNLLQYQTIPGPSSTTAFLLHANKPDQLQCFVDAIWKLQSTEIPLSNNSLLHHHRADTTIHEQPLYETDEEEDNEDDKLHEDPERAAAAVLQDTLLETEIVFDLNDMDDDDFDLF